MTDTLHPADGTGLAGAAIETIMLDGRDGLYLADYIDHDGHRETYLGLTVGRCPELTLRRTA